MAKRPYTVLSGPDGDASAVSDEMQISMLGGGCEVGRSCCVIKYRGATIVCDTGIHPALTGLPSLPFIDELDWSSVDCILISHLHIDHAAGLPYIMEKTNFKDGGGRVYMTHATKEAYGFLMQDFVRVSMMSSAAGDPKLFDDQDLQTSFASIHSVAFHEEVFVPARPSTSTTPTSSTSIRFMTYPAGHIIGACMFLIEVGGVTVLYTGDYNTDEDRHLIPASIPAGGWGSNGARPDVMICESTFGVQTLEPRRDKEERFCAQVRSTLKRGGRVLIPIFALGTAQELLLVLDEYWAAHPELHQYPIYHISALASRGLRLYRAYTSFLSSKIQSRTSKGDNPFDFQKGRFVREMKDARRGFDDSGPCVVLATSGMLQDGLSRVLLERWAPDRRNALLLCGFSAEGTLARDLQKEPEDFTSLDGKKIPRRMTVEYISFAAHVDYAQNLSFIDQVKPAHLVLVHGETNNVLRLRSALKKHFTDSKMDVQIYTPRNTDILKISLTRSRIGRAVGSLADSVPKGGTTLSALLVSKDAQYTLLLPSDLHEFTGLSTSSILQRQTMKVSVGWEMIRWHLENLFGSVRTGHDDKERRTMRVMEAVDVKQVSATELMIEWAGGSTNDMIADSVLALLFGIDSSRASVKLTSGKSLPESNTLPPPEDAPPSKALKLETEAQMPPRIDRLIGFLSGHFGDVSLITAEEARADVGEVADALTASSMRGIKKEEDTEDLYDDQDNKGLKDDEVLSEDDDNDESLKAKVDAEAPVLRVRVDDAIVDVLLGNLAVSGNSEILKKRVESVVDLALQVVTPLSDRAKKMPA